MGSRALIQGKIHFCRRVNWQITSGFSYCTSTRKSTGSINIMENKFMVIQDHLMRTKVGNFLPLGLRELSHSSVHDNSQTKMEEYRMEKKDAQNKLENVKEKHLRIHPPQSSEYVNRNEWGIDFHHWKGKFMSSVKHYWHGTKLLWTDTRISSKLLFQVIINGKELSRREKRQLTRTTSDILKFVPFAVFIIVPFMEFFMPVLLKLFPNMLPSTFKAERQNKERMKNNLKGRMEYTKFLQETIKEMEKEIRSTKSSEIEKTAEDLDEFMTKVRSVEALRGAVYSLPDSVVSTLGTSLPSVSERRRKLEFLEMQEELIKEEEKERTLAAQKADEHVRSKMKQKQDFCKISRALSLLASASSGSQEREELLSLVDKEIELYNAMLEKKSSGSLHDAKKTYKEARGAVGCKPSSKLAEKVDRLLNELENEIDDVDAIIGTREQLLDKNHDGKVTTEEMAAAAIYLKENLDKATMQQIIANLSKDKG